MKINNLKKRLLVILRTTSESTEQLCEKLVKNQLKKNDLIIKCSYVPFSKTLEKAYELAFQEKFAWTLMIDSDVLIKSKSIEKIIYYGNKYNSLVIQGYVLDYLYGGPRSGGLHLYSYEAIERINNLKPNIFNEIRPETYCKNLICPNGNRFRSLPLILGVHDYFQFENDYYRKVLFFYTKNSDIIGTLSKIWKLKNYQRIVEIDSLINKKFSNNSINKLKICTVDYSFPTNIQKEDRSLLLEKISKIDQNYVDNICNNWSPEILYLSKFLSIYLRLLFNKDFARSQYKILKKKKRFFKVMFFLITNFLTFVLLRSSNKLKNIFLTLSPFRN